MTTYGPNVQWSAERSFTVYKNSLGNFQADYVYKHNSLVHKLNLGVSDDSV